MIADGATSESGAGGGSGGSIWISAGNIGGIANISANGGAGNLGGGAGGRIAVLSPLPLLLNASLSISAHGGASGNSTFVHGGAGTVSMLFDIKVI